MDRVIIGVDPHKLSVTIEARDDREILRATGQFRTDARSYRQLLDLARQWPERIWAVEGANGIGRPITQRLLASGEQVLDVPAKLAARARVFDTGQGRKTDAADAHAIVMVALRDKGLREISVNPDLAVLRMLCDRRDELSRARAQALNHACYFMSRNNRVTNEGKFAIPNHQVAMAHAAGVDFDEHLTIAWRWHGAIFNLKSAFGFFQDCYSHGTFH